MKHFMILIYVMNLNEHFLVFEIKMKWKYRPWTQRIVKLNTQSKSFRYAMPSNGSSLLISCLHFFDVGELVCAWKKYLSKKTPSQRLYTWFSFVRRLHCDWYNCTYCSPCFLMRCSPDLVPFWLSLSEESFSTSFPALNRLTHSWISS